MSEDVVASTRLFAILCNITSLASARLHTRTTHFRLSVIFLANLFGPTFTDSDCTERETPPTQREGEEHCNRIK